MDSPKRNQKHQVCTHNNLLTFYMKHLTNTQSIEMNDYWHIPRASLSPSSASSAVSSASSTHRSNRSSLSSHGKQKLTPTHHQRSQALQSKATMQGHTFAAGGRFGGRRSDSDVMSATKVTTDSSHLATAKRGSRSSQGSNDSSNSTRSAASGSLLLTAANLERMTEIHRKQQKQQHHNRFQQSTIHHISSTAAHSSANYNANLVHAAASINATNGIKAITSADTTDHQQLNTAADHADSIINIDPNLDFVKTKDLDTVSIASSMHFTMVNGETGTNKKTKKGLCDRGRQVTVLIVSMSTIFLLLIMGMVYALEMRARDMPQS